MQSQHSPAELGVVVVSYNVSELLADCLASLHAEIAAADLDAEVVVVDNASSDDSVRMVETAFPTVRIEALSQNRGFASGNNVALEPWAADSSRCPRRVLLLNPDTLMRTGALGTLISALDETPDVGVVGPKLVFPDGRLQHCAFRFPGVVQTVLDLFPVPRLANTPLNGRYTEANYASHRAFGVDFVLGACMLARGSAVVEVGALDASFRMYCEEIDWCRRFESAGYRVICAPQAEVVHHSGASTGQQPTAMFVELWRSRLQYFAKHEPTLRYGVLATTVRTGLAVRRCLDRLACARGKISREDRDARAGAYRSIFRPEDRAA